MPCIGTPPTVIRKTHAEDVVIAVKVKTRHRLQGIVHRQRAREIVAFFSQNLRKRRIGDNIIGSFLVDITF